ncbi:PIG-L family deacetylase [Leifsonia sp. NPDC056665]|uniref:PIG-L family deacetylase n=1 Tax=Leifsonia sp. NPDC056665 TaxID=3345901 RepID=UPI003681B7F5
MIFDPFIMATPAAVWEDSARWSSVPRRTRDWLAGFTRIVVFSAHPDDETLGVGGLLVQAGELGIDISVIVATSDREERVVELTSALSRLGTTIDLTVLGLTDGGLKHEADLLRDGIELALAARRSDTMLVLAPWPGDRHGDHRTLGREVAAACAVHGDTLMLYPVWLWQWGSPDDLPWARVSEVELSASARARKRVALSAFASQLHTSANPEGVLTSAFVERAVHGREVLFEPEESVIGDHFEALHQVSADPWSVRTRWYERRKRLLTSAVLPKEQYARGFEIGCSNGEMSALLAERCEALVCVDSAPTAVALASERTAAASNVVVQRMRIPEEWPEGSFDLVVVSEVVYYLAADQWAETVDRILGSLAEGGHVVLCHWTGHADDFAQSGWDAHAAFAKRAGLRVLVQHQDEGFLLEVFG